MNAFLDRRDAGRMLATRLAEYRNRTDVTVLAMPRGGVPVAFEVARALRAPLDLFLVQKVYEPGRDDIQIGTITSGGFEVVDMEALAARGVDRRVADRELARARQDLAYRERLYRGNGCPPNVRGRTILLVYDGIVTGDSMVAAVNALRACGAAQVVVAAPVATREAFQAVQRVADACVCLMLPDPFYRIGVWYDDYAPVSDATVLKLLDSAARELGGAAAA